MTANNVVAQQTASVTSLAQALERGYTFCGWGSTASYLTTAYPAMNGRFFPMDGGPEMARAMDDGTCTLPWTRTCRVRLLYPSTNARILDLAGDAAIMEDITWQAVQAEEEDCTASRKILLAELIYSPVIALAVRSDLQRPLTWAISHAKGAGQWNLADRYARAKFIPPPKCSAALARAPTTSRSLDVQTGAGVLYLSLFLTTAGPSAWDRLPVRPWVHTVT